MPARAFGILGDELTKALVSGDFRLYHEVMALPLRIVSRGVGVQVIEDEAALRLDFDLYHTVMRLHGVTDIFRQVQSLHHEGEGRVRIHAKVHIMVRANRLVEPFLSVTAIQRDADDGWRIHEIESTPGHIAWTRGEAEVGTAGRFLSR